MYGSVCVCVYMHMHCMLLFICFSLLQSWFSVVALLIAPIITDTYACMLACVWAMAYTNIRKIRYYQSNLINLRYIYTFILYSPTVCFSLRSVVCYLDKSIQNLYCLRHRWQNEMIAAVYVFCKLFTYVLNLEMLFDWQPFMTRILV